MRTCPNGAIQASGSAVHALPKEVAVTTSVSPGSPDVVTGEPIFNPFEAGFAEDPYPHYADLRERAPVQQHPMGFWVLTRYDHVAELLRASLSVEDAKAADNPMRAAYEAAVGDVVPRGGGLSMLDRDPPDHTRLRRLVAKAFTPRMVETLEPRVRVLVAEALERIADLGRCDLIAELAFPLPFAVITDLLGMPDTDQAQLRELSHLVVKSLEPVMDPQEMRAIAAAQEAMAALADEAIAWKRGHPADDLLSALIAAEDDGSVLSNEELVSQVILLYLAGHETTVNLIGNGVLALLRSPDQVDAWRSNPAAEENAVEELLRFDSPVQMSRRITLSGYPVDGRTIPPGAFVIASLASANRDPAMFGADAGRLRLNRPNSRQHLSFGNGVHHCLGAALARLEGRIAVGELIRRFDVSLDGDVHWNGRINLRGLSELPVSVTSVRG